MRKSLFSSLKIVAMMLATDNDLHPKEKAWFLAITKNHGATFAERSKLQDYLQKQSPESLHDILSDIVEEEDKRRLLKFVQMAMRQDGIVRNAEIEFFHKIQNELQGRLQHDQQELARALLKRDKEIRIWKQLDLLGRVWSHKLPVVGISGHFYYADGVFWESFVELVVNHKYKIFLLTAVLIFALGSL